MATSRRIAIAMLAAIVVVAAIGIGDLRFNSHYTAYFDSNDPLLVAHEEISELYSRQDSLFIVLQSSSSFLESRNYQLVESLTESLGANPLATSVVSISQLDIVGETLSEDGVVIPSLQQVKDEVWASGLLLAENLQFAGISVQLALPDKNAKALLAAVDDIRNVVATQIDGLPVSAHYTGTLALNEAYIEVVRHDLLRIVPLLLLVMIVVLGLLLRSARAVLGILPIGIFSVIAAFGVAGLVGTELAAVNSFVPIIIFTISLAGCVHMALSFSRYRNSDVPADEAAVMAVSYNLLPMSLANGTTAIGFLGLSLSPSPPIRVIGYLVATGIAVSFVLCMTLLPVLQARFDPWKPPGRYSSAFLARLARFAKDRRIAIISLFLLLSLPAAWFASRNVITDNVFEYFVPSHVFSKDTQIVDEHFSGVNELLYSVDSGERYALFNADVIAALARFSAWLGDQPEVNRAISIADSRVLAEARQEGRLQQRLDFYRERVDRLGDGIPRVAMGVSDDYSSSLVTAYLRQMDSAALLEFDRRAHAWAAGNLVSYDIKSGGPALMFASLGQQNIRGMLIALTIALLGAAVILGAVLRSARIAWIGLVCNMLPVLLVYSVWAVVIGQISIGAAVVMGMILGIVLDDTIYLLATYRLGLERSPCDPVGYALQRVGPALIMTTVTLLAGLSLGILSDFGPIWSMSVLSVAVIGTALIVDMLLLPALLPRTRPQGVNP